MELNWTIPDDELQFTFVRASGPGGQNVNKVNSKAVLRWNLAASPTVPDAARARLLTKLANRLTVEGDLLITSQKYRDQPKNIDDCREKLLEMLRSALVEAKPRRATRPTKGSKQRRLTAKKQTAQKKQGRQGRGTFGE